MRTLLLTLTTCLLVLPAQAKYSGGTGEPNDPYQIATAADLIALGETPEDYDKHFILTADIDLDPNLPGRKVFDKAVIAPDTDPGDSWGGPLFTGPPFAGVLDGDGHAIDHLTIVGKDYVGLFGECSGTVKNAAVVNVNIAGSGEQVGGLVGCNSGTVTQCYSTGVVDANTDVGGLVGYNFSIVTQCHSATAVSGGKGVGGLVGYNFSIVTDCYSTFGVIGGWYVGGLAGYNFGRMIDCYSTGAVGGWAYVGGLVGYNYGGIFRCYSTGSVDAPGDFGGLVEPWNSGGLAGDGYGDVIGCFWDTQTSGRDVSCGGAGQPTDAMQNVKVYLDAGWDFVGEAPNGTHEIWQMPQGGGYPVLSVFNGYTPPKLQGSGTPDRPYLISDARELGAIVSYSPDASYQLTASIDLSGIRWNRTVIPSFAGTFDGNGQTISHLTIAGEGILGLFGQLASGAEVKNLGVVGVNMAGSSSYIGGLVGWVDHGSVTHCYSTGVIQAIDSYYVGGLVGLNSGTLTQCHSIIAVAADGSRVGGPETLFGGLVGSNEGSVTQCYSAGTVNGRGSAGGGLVGRNGWLGSVTHCYSTSAVTGSGCLGGLVGHHVTGYVTQCYSTGSVSGGGLVGWSGCEVMACIPVVAGSMWDIETSGQGTSDGGTGKTTAEMQTASTFLEGGWDFVDEIANGTEDIWWIDEGKDYPRLWWEAHN